MLTKRHFKILGLGAGSLVVAVTGFALVNGWFGRTAGLVTSLLCCWILIAFFLVPVRGVLPVIWVWREVRQRWTHQDRRRM